MRVGGNCVRFPLLALTVALAFAAQSQAGIIYTTNTSTDSLGKIDTGNLAAGIQNIGSLGYNAGKTGLAYDSNTGTMYMVDGFTDQLYMVDVNTGAATVIGPLGFPSLTGAAFDTNDNILYATQENSSGPTGFGGLFSVDVTNGAATHVGGNRRMMGLAYDSLRDELIGTHVGGSRVYRVDQSNGSVTQVRFGGLFNLNGLAYDKEADLIWNLGFNGKLMTYNPSLSYAETVVEYPDSGGGWTGLAWTPVPEPSTASLIVLGLVGLAVKRKVSPSTL